MFKGEKNAFKVGPGSRILQFASLSFDAATWEFLMALISGSALVLTSTQTITDGQALVNLLEALKVSTMTIPPSVLAVLPKSELPDLKTIITAGEAVSPELVKIWGQERIFFNAYGPTETTVCASMYECSGEYEMAPPIGKANPNFKLYIMDTYMNPCPVGVPGELCVAGIGLARDWPKETIRESLEDPVPSARLQVKADEIIYQIREYRRQHVHVVGILGKNGSPSCGVEHRVFDSGHEAGEGVFIRILRETLERERLTDVGLKGLDDHRQQEAVEWVRSRLGA